MGQAHSRCSSGKQLISVVAENNTTAARQILSEHPEASCYSTCIERNSPLLVAAGRGHARMVQAILEAAVLSQGLTRAKKRCINHSNSKGQSALMLACISGHAQCVEVLVCNGASPLVLDNARHNSALHWAASCCRADCIGRLLGTGAIFQMQSGQLVAIADIPCFDDDNSTLVKFVDRHNGWGLTALHLATYKGSSSTVRALLRHGASVSARTTAPSLAISPQLQPPGSTALHFAAAAEDVSLVLVLLEAQVSRNEPDMRRVANANGQRPIDLAPSSLSANPLLIQLLDPSHPISLHAGHRSGIVLNPGSSMSRVVTREGLRQQQTLLGLSSGGGFRASRRGLGADGQQPHVTLGALLQRLKLVLSLEAFALQQQLAAAVGSNGGGLAAAVAAAVLAKQQHVKQQQLLASGAGFDGEAGAEDAIGTAPAADAADVAADPATHSSTVAAGADVRQQQEPGLSSNRTASSGLSSSSTPPEIYPSSSGDDTRAMLDIQQQQRQQCTAQLAAQQLRLKMLQQIMGAVDNILSVLPASATVQAAASSGSVSPRGPSPVSSTQQQQQQQQQGHAARHDSSTSRTLASSSWGLLGGLLARSSTGTHPHAEGGAAHNEQQQHQHQQRRFTRRRSDRSSDGTGSDNTSNPVPLTEDVLAAYITPSMLSSLAAVTKLFVGASSLSGTQQQQQQQQDQQQGSAGDDSNIRWAEQEHALVLLKGILKTLRTSLEAAQSAAAAAASRSALRQRHQQQLANLLGSENRPVHSHSLRRALLGERLVDQGRIRFGSGSTNSSSRQDNLAAAYLGGMGMSLGMDTPLGSSSLPLASGGRHSSSRRHHHRERSRRLRGEEGSDGAQESGRRHHRHHSRHQRSGRRRTQRAVELPMHDIPVVEPTGGRQTHRLDPAVAATAADRAPREAASSNSSNQLPTGQDVASLAHVQQQQLGQAVGASEQHRSSPAGQAPEIEPERSIPLAAAAAAAAAAAVASQPGVSLHSTTSSASSSSGGNSSSAEDAELTRGNHDVILPGDDVNGQCGDDITHDITHPDSDSDDGLGAGGSLCSSLDATTCAICMDCTAGVSVSRCSHSLCLQCAYQLCYKAKGLPLCPFCRQPIDGFDAAAVAPAGS